MKSLFTKKLFRIKNKSNHAYLIITSNSSEVLQIVMNSNLQKKRGSYL